MNCSNCGFDNPDGMKFCGGCGSALQNLCPQCGFENPPRFRFCGECGTSLTGERTTPSPAQEEPPDPVEPPPPEHRLPEAERRQLTVMFCDLVGSTELSGRLDAEDYREIVRAYQTACTDVIQRYDGHVAQLLGDGLLVYFGFPQAHEDDAQRAVHTGLGIIDAIGTLNTRLEQDKGVKLAVRLGIHTGLVVVGEMGGQGRQEQLALGEVPNIASRLEGLATPNTVVLSDATYRLIQGYFECESMGEQILRGLADPIAVYRVLSESGAQSRLDIASARGLTPIVGREQEIGLLLDRWEQSREGNGQVVLLSGEAGIGKSRLAQVLKDHVSEDNRIRLECRSSPYFTNSALYPVIDMLQRTLRFQTDDTSEQKLEKLTQNLSQYRLPLEESVPLFGALLSLLVPEDRYPPLSWTPQRQRQKTLEAIVAIILELAEREPVLFILEDLHWTDPTTLEFLYLLIDQTPTVSACLLLTCRPEFQPDWSHRSYLSELSLNRLSHTQIEQIATQVAGGKTLPAEIIQQLVDKTDGVPLYVEEMTKAVLESGVLNETNGHYELIGSVASLAIPATLQDSLMARLDRLVTAKGVAQYASVIGRQFSYELLQAVSELDEATLQRELGRLVEAELMYQRGVIPQATYIFKHALIQDTAYESLLRSTRQGYHRRIAEVLVERFPGTFDTQPELLAHHYTEAGLSALAVAYWEQAGKLASERSAHVEAISHLTKGLNLLTALPQTPEGASRELTMQLALGPAWMATRGYAAPEVQHTYARARELCSLMGDAPQLFPILMGLCRFYYAGGVMQTARELGEQLLTLAQHHHETSWLVVAHTALGTTLCFMGEFTEARGHLELGIAPFINSQEELALARRWSTIPRIQCLIWEAYALLMLGYPDQALHKSREAYALSQELAHPHSLVYTLFQTARFHIIRRDIRAAQELTETAMRLATEQASTLWAAASMFIQGFMRVAKGEHDLGLVQMSQSMTMVLSTGAGVFRPMFLVWFADAYKQLDQTEEGLHFLEKAQATIDGSGQRYNESELYRLKGELLLQQDVLDASKAEACFHHALDIARSQQAKLLELRVVMKLSRLWQSQGKRDEARELLAPVYGWFTEGFDTADLIDAKSLLDELK